MNWGQRKIKFGFKMPWLTTKAFLFLQSCMGLRGQPNILIFDEAVSNLDPQTAEHFVQTINKLKGKVSIVFITHQLPSSLQIDAVVQLGEVDSIFT
ncbi:hypothetical protein [Methylophilus sp. 5]|uniref:hypothetical protein n=1 Tax=Methylophilus sp. 5 TaxID=1112274 RepID=UPI00048E8933|nr:hypothetical protein [Methylophilus sp. 5]